MQVIKQIEVILRGIKLGVLSYNENTKEFFYNSDIEAEEKYCKIHYKQLEKYDLWGSVNLKTMHLPGFLNQEVKDILNREDILKALRLTAAASPFNILWEYGRFPYNKANVIAFNSVGATKVDSTKRLWGIEND